MSMERVIADQLEGARRNIEDRFILAGGLLEGAIDVVGKQIEALENLIGAINEQAVEETAGELLAAAARLIELPAAQAQRRESMVELGEQSEALHRHIDEMRVTLKYLRVFAFNMQITAAGSVSSAASFVGFTDEVLDHIDLGVGELAAIDRQLEALQQQLRAAQDIGHEIQTQCGRLLPAVPDSLASDAAAIAAFHQNTSQAAARVAVLARKVQQRVASALSSLQIGDITRQRIEHVQASLGLVETWDFGDADQALVQALRGRFFAMLTDQMDNIVADFDREASRMMSSLAGLADDSAHALRFQDHAAEDNGRVGLRGLEGSVAQAVGLVNDVEAASDSAVQIGRSTNATVQGLVQRVGSVQTVRADVQRMAINASLRCSRLGDEGRPLSVIATELGDHAGRLDLSAGRTLSLLESLRAVASGLGEDLDQGADAAEARFADRLQMSLDRLRQAADIVDRDLHHLTARSGDVSEALARTGDQLRLQEDLGAILAHAADALRAQAVADPCETGDGDPAYDRLMDRVHALYTMGSERVVHARHVTKPVDAAEAEASPMVANGLF